MSTLETQYKNYMTSNPNSTFTFEEWKKDFGSRIGNSLSEILKEIRSPEYKRKCIEENEKYLEECTIDQQFGFYVGEYIINNYLPTLSTDYLQTRNVIQVNEEDTVENKKLNEQWYLTTRHQTNWNGKDDGSPEKWEQYYLHNKMLEQKYLPPVLDCCLDLIKIDNEKEFKKGIYNSLWNSDRCSYDIEPENIKIEYDMEIGFTKISFYYDKNCDVEK